MSKTIGRWRRPSTGTYHKPRPLLADEFFVLAGGDPVQIDRLLNATRGKKSYAKALLGALIHGSDRPAPAEAVRRYRSITEDEATRVLRNVSRRVAARHPELTA